MTEESGDDDTIPPEEDEIGFGQPRSMESDSYRKDFHR